MMRRGALRAELAKARDRGGDPYVGLNLDNVRAMGGVLWLAGGLVAAALLAFQPPTAAIGSAGWAVAAVGLGIAGVLAWRRLDRRFHPSLHEMLAAGYVGIVLIAVLAWLAGGASTAYPYLFALPAAFGGAIHSVRRLLCFGTALAAAICAPLVYQRTGTDDAVGILGLLLLVAVLGAAARILISRLRTQRATVQAERDQASVLARRDPLTGLGNRRAFEEALGGAIARARRSGRTVSVILADVNGFKCINDEHGHLRGDECLKAIAGALHATARAGDECFRWGGDEFAIVLADTGEPEALRAARRFAESVEAATFVPGLSRVSLTCAVAELAEGQGAHDLLASADDTLRGLKAGNLG